MLVRWLVLMLACVCVTACAQAPDEKSDLVEAARKSLPAPDSEEFSNELVLDPVVTQGRADVHIHNKTSEPIQLFETWNSWGYWTVSLDLAPVSSPQDVIHLVRRDDTEWTRNFPSVISIATNGEALLKMSLNSFDWQRDAYLTLREELVAQKLDAHDWFLRVRLTSSNSSNPTISDMPRVWEGKAISDWVSVRDFDQTWEIVPE